MREFFASTGHLLFVCLGNYCRSPTAEAVKRALAPDIEVDSAGTGDWHIGDPPHGSAIRVAAARGYDMSALRGRKIGIADFGRFDRIVVMDSANLRAVEALRPDGADVPISRLLDHVADTPMRDVPDPYMTGDFETALDLIEAGCRGLLGSLRA